MAHLGWFFAGTSCGLFFGVLLTSLAKISDMIHEEDGIRTTSAAPNRGLRIVRR